MASITNDIILYKPMVVLTQSISSTIGLTPISSRKQISFGVINSVYSTCDKFTVGTNVIFDLEQAYPINNNGVNYYMIDENCVLASELFIDS
jgi:hypothetical protein